MAIVSLVTGVVFLIFSGKITTTITTKIQSTYITNYYEDDDFKTVYDTLQKNYQCCGITNYTDWNSNPYHNCSSAASTSALKCLVPSSCCKNTTDVSSTPFGTIFLLPDLFRAYSKMKRTQWGIHLKTPF